MKLARMFPPALPLLLVLSLTGKQGEKSKLLGIF